MQPSLDARARRLQPRRPPGLKGEHWRALRRGLAWTREQRTMAIETWLRDLGVGAAAASLPPLSALTAAKPHGVWIRWAAAAALLVAGSGLAAFAVNQHQDFDWRSTMARAEDTFSGAWQRLQSMADASDATTSAALVKPVEAAAATPPAPSASTWTARKLPATPVRTASASPPAARSSRLAGEPDAENSAAASETVAVAASPAPPDHAQASGASAGSLQFSAASYIVSGAEPAARIIIRRSGSTDGDVDFVWWTEEGSAKADVDYASLGRRVERIPSGTDKITVFVPIISNPRHDSTQFYVELGEPGSYNTSGPGTRSIVTIDHGN